MIDFAEKMKCCGCEACVQACKLHCITMEMDEEGFSYPLIDPDKCISCGACDRVCPIQSAREKPVGMSVYAARCLDEETRRTSSSGGIFSLLARKTFEKGGAVFGAAFESDFSVSHKPARSLEKLEALKGSKYVQSRIGDSFRQAEQLLKQGIPVLFTGTPCQISGLHSFLGKKYENLYTAEILCHGVPSFMVWRKYLQEQEMKNGSKLWGVSFRDKASGWHQYAVRIFFDNQKNYEKVFYEDSFMKLFLKNICLRPSCHDCQFREGTSGADLTIGDAWGIEKWMPEMDDDKGTSVVVVNSGKGRQLLTEIRDEAEIRKSDAETALAGNPVYYKSVMSHPNRKKFFEALEKGASMEELLLFCKEPVWKRMISFCKRAAKKLLKRSNGWRGM